LQALAYDRVLPKFFASNMGSETEPRAAVVTSSVIALIIIWMGDLNFVAPIITMFFLNTYGMVNLTAGLEKLANNPSFRPQIKIHWIFSLLGAAGCYGAMFLINWIATIFAIVLSTAIFFILEQRSMKRTWGDVRQGIWFALSRFSLLKLEDYSWHVKNWRPNILVFTGQPYNREQLVEVSECLTTGRGIVTFSQLIIGDVGELGGRGMRDVARKHIKNYIRERNMMAFAESQIVPEFNQGVLAITQSHGIGGLEPNSILMGWSRESGGAENQLRLQRELFRIRKSIFFLHFDQDRGFGEKNRIDVWWGGKDRNAELMLLLSHLFILHPSWRGAEVRLLRVVDKEEGRETAELFMGEMLEDVRVDAQPVAIVRDDPEQRISNIIREESEHTDLTFIGMKVPELDEIPGYAKYLTELVNDLGTVMLIRSAQTEDVLETG